MRFLQTRPSVGLVVSVCCLGLLAAVNMATAEASGRTVACRADVHRGVLPVWARDGFSDPKPRMPYVLGAAGKITGILWADPLVAPPAKDHSNKILWVSRATTDFSSDLRITAQRMVGTKPIGSPVTRRVMGGPGPSIINLPSPGCWQLTLRWSGRVDTLDLEYAANR